jgi:hypothetical protein
VGGWSVSSVFQVCTRFVVALMLVSHLTIDVPITLSVLTGILCVGRASIAEQEGNRNGINGDAW